MLMAVKDTHHWFATQGAINRLRSRRRGVQAPLTLRVVSQLIIFDKLTLVVLPKATLQRNIAQPPLQ